MFVSCQVDHGFCAVNFRFDVVTVEKCFNNGHSSCHASCHEW